MIQDLKSIKDKRRICHLEFNFNTVDLISVDNNMEFEIGDADYNVVGMGSLDSNALRVEKDQDKAKEVLIPMDEESVTENIVFTTEIKVTKAKKEGNNQDNI